MIEVVKQKTIAVAANKTAVILLISLIFAAALSYVYFTSSAVRSLTALEKTKAQMQSLSVEVSEMESQRLTFENNINKEKALRLGFVEVSNPSFIMKNSASDSAGAALSMKMN
jgi:hypothetical protein